MKQRFSALTGLRAIAAMLIFCFHFRKFWLAHLPKIFTLILKECHIGVSIFFVLSGFLIAYTYQDKPLGSKREYVKYLAIRLVRIFPVYLLILTVKYLDQGFPSPKETVLNYTLLKGFSDKYNLSGIPQSWSLTVELTFYVLAPLIWSLAKQRLRRPLIYLSGLLLGAWLLGLIPHLFGYNKDSWLYNFQFILDSTFFGRWVEFYMGIVLAFVVQRKDAAWSPQPGTRFTWTGSIGVLASCFLIGCFGEHFYNPGTSVIPGILVRNLILPVFVAVLLYGLIIEKNGLQRILGSRLFVLLGNASYIFYLIHINYGYALLARIKVFPDYNFTFLWLVSIVGYLLFEKPVYNVARKYINGERRPVLNPAKSLR